jgi:hypothetical protein
MLIILIVSYCLLAWKTHAFTFRPSGGTFLPIRRIAAKSRLFSFPPLIVPEEIKAKFTQIEKNEDIPNLGKYRLVSELSSEVMLQHKDEYFKSLKKQYKGRTIFNGFPDGCIPDDELHGIAEILISFGLEMQISELCYVNGLEVRFSVFGDSVFLFSKPISFPFLDLWSKQGRCRTRKQRLS